MKTLEHDGCKGCAHEDKTCEELPCRLCRGTVAFNSPARAAIPDLWEPAGEANPAAEYVRNAVSHPSHYTQGGIECIKAIKASMSPEEYKGYLKGNALKYIWRYQLKGHPAEDLAKAAQYLGWLRAEVEEEK